MIFISHTHLGSDAVDRSIVSTSRSVNQKADAQQTPSRANPEIDILYTCFIQLKNVKYSGCLHRVGAMKYERKKG
jgi:hypothetical protein